MNFVEADPSSLNTFVMVLLAVLGSVYLGARFSDRVSSPPKRMGT